MEGIIFGKDNSGLVCVKLDYPKNKKRRGTGTDVPCPHGFHQTDLRCNNFVGEILFGDVHIILSNYNCTFSNFFSYIVSQFTKLFDL